MPRPRRNSLYLGTFLPLSILVLTAGLANALALVRETFDSKPASPKDAVAAAWQRARVSVGIISTPQVAITPAALTVTLAPNQQVNESLTIRNQGSGSLDWSIVETSVGDPSGSCQASQLGWVNATPNSGSILADYASDILVQFDSQGLPFGHLRRRFLPCQQRPTTPCTHDSAPSPH